MNVPRGGTMSYFRPVFLGTGLAACLATFMSCASLSTPAQPLVYAFHAAPTGTGTLRVRTSELIHRKEPLAVALRAIYQYDPAADAWTRLAGPQATWMVPIPQPRQLYSADTDPVLHTLPPVGLFWVTWEEEGHRHASPAYSGP